MPFLFKMYCARPAVFTTYHFAINDAQIVLPLFMRNAVLQQCFTHEMRLQRKLDFAVCVRIGGILHANHVKHAL